MSGLQGSDKDCKWFDRNIESAVNEVILEEGERTFIPTLLIFIFSFYLIDVISKQI